jgi:hypothetical protein
MAAITLAGMTRVPMMGAVMVVTAVGMVATVAEVEMAVAMGAAAVAAAVVAVEEATPRYGTRKQGKLESARASESIICAIELFRWPPSPPAGYDFQYTSAPVNP